MSAAGKFGRNLAKCWPDVLRVREKKYITLLSHPQPRKRLRRDEALAVRERVGEGRGRGAARGRAERREAPRAR